MERIYLRTLFTIGGSIGVTLPRTFKNRKYLAHGTRVVVTEYEDSVLIETINKSSLEKLGLKNMEDELYKNKKNQLIVSQDYAKKSIQNNVRRGPKWQK